PISHTGVAMANQGEDCNGVPNGNRADNDFGTCNVYECQIRSSVSFDYNDYGGNANPSYISNSVTVNTCGNEAPNNCAQLQHIVSPLTERIYNTITDADDTA